jgi:hypothetical protein
MERSPANPPRGETPPLFMEHRWGQRMRCRARVWMTDGSRTVGEGRIRDISSSGAFIETACGNPPSARLRLTVSGNESATRTVELAATVVRVEPDGIGVEWCETPGGAVCSAVGCTTRCDWPHGE